MCVFHLSTRDVRLKKGFDELSTQQEGLRNKNSSTNTNTNNGILSMRQTLHLVSLPCPPSWPRAAGQ